MTSITQQCQVVSLLGHSINMAHIRNIRRCAAALACVSLGILAGPVVLATGAAATERSSVAPFPSSNVDLVGFGNGSGLGMGQWGAFGYAALDHKTYQWILAHYYGGTTLSSSDSSASTRRSRSISTRTTEIRSSSHPSPRSRSVGFCFLAAKPSGQLNRRAPGLSRTPRSAHRRSGRGSRRTW